MRGRLGGQLLLVGALALCGCSSASSPAEALPVGESTVAFESSRTEIRSVSEFEEEAASLLEGEAEAVVGLWFRSQGQSWILLEVRPKGEGGRVEAARRGPAGRNGRHYWRDLEEPEFSELRSVLEGLLEVRPVGAKTSGRWSHYTRYELIVVDREGRFRVAGDWDRSGVKASRGQWELRRFFDLAYVWADRLRWSVR